MTWHRCPPGVIAQSVKVSIRPPVHVLFTHSHSCNSWISQSYGWSEDWARRGRFSPIVKHETAQQPAQCVWCAVCVLTWITVTVFSVTSLRSQMRVISGTSDRRFAAAAASWWVPSLNYLLPEVIMSSRLLMSSSTHILISSCRLEQGRRVETRRHQKQRLKLLCFRGAFMKPTMKKLIIKTLRGDDIRC